MSRALGDFIYKIPQNQAENPQGYLARAVRDGAKVKGDFISNEPLVQRFDLLQCGEAPFLVAGSDGVFGEMTDQQVVETVARMRLERKATAQAIVDTIVKGIGDLEYSDNVSCIVAFFDQEATPSLDPQAERTALPVSSDKPSADHPALNALHHLSNNELPSLPHSPDFTQPQSSSSKQHSQSQTYHQAYHPYKSQHHHHHHHHHASPIIQKTSQTVGPDELTKIIDLPNGEKGRVFEHTPLPREE